jgi:RNA polymerase sigma-70 factor (ECF subfamily)
LSKIAADVRTVAHEGLQAPPTQLSRLRDQLSEDERALLIVRVDRGLSWNEIAQSMGDGDELLVGTALTRQAAALRKRFERIKERLRGLAKEAGLLPES